MTVKEFIRDIIDAVLREPAATSEEPHPKPSDEDLAYMADLRRRILEKENEIFEDALVDEYGYVILPKD